MENIFNEKEYNALDYYLQKSKLYDSGFYIEQDKNGDYFKDDEFGKRYSIKKGLQIVYESMVLEYIKEYPSEIKKGLKKVFKRFLDIDLEV